MFVFFLKVNNMITSFYVMVELSFLWQTLT